MRIPLFIFLMFLYLIQLGCAAVQHGATQKKFEGQLLYAKSGPGNERLKIEMDYDAALKVHVEDKGIPDYIFVVSSTEGYIVDISRDEFTVFKRPFLSTNSDISISKPIPLEILALVSDEDGDKNYSYRFNKTENNRLIAAARLGNYVAVNDALKKGADPNVTGQKGETALMIASWNGHVDIVQKLITSGADINASNKTIGNTALSLAVANGQEEVVRALITAGANINKKDMRGFTPLNLAAEKGGLGIVKMLVEKGADVNNQSSTGATPLMGAAAGDNSEIVKYLILNGANAHAEGPLGKASVIAFTSGHKGIFKLLIEAEKNQK